MYMSKIIKTIGYYIYLNSVIIFTRLLYYYELSYTNEEIISEMCIPLDINTCLTKRRARSKSQRKV